MLTKKTSAPFRAVKFGLVAPLALLFAMLFRQAPALAQVVDEKHLAFVRELESQNWLQTDTVITFDPNTYQESVKIVSNSAAPEADESGKLVYRYAEIQPQFPGGVEAMYQFLISNLKYPELAKQNKVEGTVMVYFVVDEAGNVLHPIGKYYNEASRPLIQEAERVVKSMPKWIPAQHKGKPVRCSMTLPVKFSLPNSAAKSTTVDPEFPGGIEALTKFLSENTKYPVTAKTAGAEGMVIVKFTVKEDGSLSEVKHANLDKPLHQDLVAEAIRVVKSMPKWKPGLKDGKIVKTEFGLPMTFKL